MWKGSWAYSNEYLVYINLIYSYYVVIFHMKTLTARRRGIVSRICRRPYFVLSSEIGFIKHFNFSLIGGEYDEMTSLPGMLWLVAKLADHADDL